MHFLQTQAFWLGPLVILGPVIAWLAWQRHCQMNGGKKRRRAIASPAGDEIPGRRFVLMAFCLTLAILFGVCSLARPCRVSTHTEYAAGTLDEVTLLDFSRSMAAKDCNGKTRMQTAKDNLGNEVIPALNNNRGGVIPFAGEAEPAVYLTPYLTTISWLLEHELKISSAPGDGSALGKAFDLAFRYFDKDSTATRKKMIILYSDGGTDEQTKIDVIAAGCRARDIKLIVVGLGQSTPAVIPVSELSEEDQRMSMGAFYKVGGQIATTAIDESILDELARKAGGTYIHINTWQEFRLGKLTAELGPMIVTSQEELFFYPAALFLLFVVAAALSTQTREKSTGHNAPQPSLVGSAQA